MFTYTTHDRTMRTTHKGLLVSFILLDGEPVGFFWVLTSRPLPTLNRDVVSLIRSLISAFWRLNSLARRLRR